MIAKNIKKNITTYVVDIFISIAPESPMRPAHLNIFEIVSLRSIDHLSVPPHIMLIILPVPNVSIAFVFHLKNLVKYFFIKAFSIPICGIHHT